jgi:hypothetical protein
MNIKRAILFILLTFLLGFVGNPTWAQMGMGHCPMCGQQWDGRYGGEMQIPGNLPKPEEAWLQRLSDVMGREKLSEKQYVKDSRKYNLRMPYMRVIPDEENHIAWIGGLFQAFGETYANDAPPVKNTASPEEAYRVAMELEQELVPDYEWMIRNASDEQTRQIIETILFQTRMHYTMFQHALNMGGMMRHGMMGR